jgi:antitoxin MazE
MSKPTEDPEVRTRLVRIGRSRGVRLPKPLIDEVGLGEDVELVVRDGAIVITAIPKPRIGWAAAEEMLRQREGELLPAPPTPTRFDGEEWEW